MICKNCNKNEAVKYSKYSKGDFCSKSCANSYSRKQDKHETKKVNCITCGKEIEVDKRASSKLCKCNSCLKIPRINRNKEKFCKSCNKKLTGTRTKYCNINCQWQVTNKKQIEDWKNNKISGGDSTGRLLQNIRKYIFEKYNNKCTKCGWGEINTFSNKIPLEIEHIDGNPLNHKEENLDLICPNCHSLTKTAKGLNKGNGRYLRRKRYIEEKRICQEYKKINAIVL